MLGEAMLKHDGLPTSSALGTLADMMKMLPGRAPLSMGLKAL